MRECQRTPDGYSAALCKKITPRRKSIYSSMTNGDVKRQVEDIRPVAKEWGYSEGEVNSFLAHFNVKRYIGYSEVGYAYYTIQITPDGIEYIGRMNQ